jgi:hypothetical protein
MARREGQARTDRGRARPYRWPADRQGIILETLAIVRAESEPAAEPDER